MIRGLELGLRSYREEIRGIWALGRKASNTKARNHLADISIGLRVTSTHTPKPSIVRAKTPRTVGTATSKYQKGWRGLLGLGSDQCVMFQVRSSLLPGRKGGAPFIAPFG